MDTSTCPRKGVRAMAFTEEQIRLATDKYFYELKSQEAICAELGWPSQATLSRWIRRDARYGTLHARPEQEAPRKASRLKYPYEVRAEAVRLAEEGHLTRREISDRLGLCGAPMVTKWVTIARKHGLEALVPREEKKRIEERALHATGAVPDDIEELRRQNERLRLENAVLEKTIEILKKDPGVDHRALTNREKALIVDALRGTFPIQLLLERLGLARSSFYYQLSAMSAGDRYAALRERIRGIFHRFRATRGYRFIWAALRRGDEPVRVSEKVVRRIMAEEGLVVVYNKKKRRYSSYAGEIGEAPENLVKRDFHAGAPNRLWLTDITEFGLEAGKVYLSPIVDCFDGRLVSWSVGTRPTGELANSSLRDACGTLSEGERPVCHSDRGGHYRWPGWIEICAEHGLVRSMSKKGCSPDNSACEGLFGRIKNEFFYYRDWSGVPVDEFMERLEEYLRYYNEDRLKESLGWMSPNQYRRSLGLAA